MQSYGRYDQRSRSTGEARGKTIGRYIMLYDLIFDGFLTVAQAADRVKLTEKQFTEKMSELGLLFIS